MEDGRRLEDGAGGDGQGREMWAGDRRMVRQVSGGVRGPARGFRGPSFAFRVFVFHAHQNRMGGPENARYRVTENEKIFGPARHAERRENKGDSDETGRR